jgi:preprotein translocase subunit SecE
MIGKIKEFTNDVVKEMKKVSWPSKEQLKESTTVVIISTIVITVIVLIIDKIMEFAVNLIFS